MDFRMDDLQGSVRRAGNTSRQEQRFAGRQVATSEIEPDHPDALAGSLFEEGSRNPPRPSAWHRPLRDILQYAFEHCGHTGAQTGHVIAPP
jgi:hypothetical protein